MSKTVSLNVAAVNRTDKTGYELLGASPYLWALRADGPIFSWDDDDRAATLFCTRRDDVPNSERALEQRLCEDGAAARERAITSLVWNGAKYQIDYQIRTFDGRNIWVEERGQRLEGDGPKPTKIIGVLTNIQSRKIREDQAGYHASHDSLTGLWNASRMSESLTHMLAYARRYDEQAAYIAFCVTNLADINETYGYEAGDRLLLAIAKRLNEAVRAPDVCARVAPRSFGAGLPNCSGGEMKNVALRILAALSGAPYGTPYGDLYAKFSVGGCALSQKSTSASDAIEQVKTALAHSGLRAGEFVAYDKGLPDLKPRQAKTELTKNDVISALNDRRITLAYQPIVHAKDRKTHHYECLLRLRREDGEVVSAAEFIMAAERLGCVHLLDRRALEIASKTLQEQSQIKLALNVSAATVQSADTANAYLASLKGLGQANERVIIEMTETVALESPDMASKFSVEARSFGCQFAIDDFGAGYTTFKNLMAVEADEIKIDGSFIRDLSITPHKQVFVRMMVDLAQTFSVRTVAEMVGSREDADLLTRLGVDYLQGYMFGVPGPAPISTD